MRSEHFDVGNGKVVFEQGPRTLRPSGAAAMVTLELVGLQEGSLDRLILI